MSDKRSGPDVTTFGESMVAVRCGGQIKLGGAATLSIAGAESNVAIGLARLGHRVRWGCRVGADQSGELILRTLRAENVLTDTVVRDPDAATGLLMFEQRLPDVTRVEYHRAGSAASRSNTDDVTALLTDTPRVLHLTGITPALSPQVRTAVEAAMAQARADGVLISFDVNYRSLLWSTADASTVLRPLAKAADIVVASDDELALVAADADELLAGGVSEVVVKKGADGAVAHTRAGVRSADGFSVTAVDSIGAGDAFTAGYLSALLDGLGVSDRLTRGNALGAFAVSSRSDWEGLPTRDELSLIDSEAGEAFR